MKDVAVIAVVAVLSASFGAMATIWVTDDGQESTISAAPDSSELQVLRQRVQVLEEQLNGFEPLSGVPQPAMAESQTASPLSPVQAPQSGGADPATTATSTRESRYDRMARRQQQIQSQLLQAGWTQAEIDDVNRLRDVVALDMLEDSHRRQREMIEKYPEMAGWRGVRDPLRQSMSEEKYESYLEATGRPTSARVGNLLPGSPGAAAGLQDGDRIVRYGDQRVYGGGDLEYATLQGNYGEPVTIEVERDGSTFILTVPRGPIGISSFRFRN